MTTTDIELLRANKLYSEGHRKPLPQLHRTYYRPMARLSLSPPKSSLRSHDVPHLDTNLEPALSPSVAAPTCRLSKVPHLPLIPPSSSPVMQTPQTQAQQMMFPRTTYRSSLAGNLRFRWWARRNIKQ